jgi:alpha-tubulin suppressor-like RCC1 family protein
VTGVDHSFSAWARLGLAASLLLPAGCNSPRVANSRDVDAADARSDGGPPDAGPEVEVASDAGAEAGTDGDGGPDAPSPPGPFRIASGQLHLCAWRADDLFCWGQNHEGELGIGTQSDWESPMRVAGLQGVRHVAIGDQHTCAADGAGQVWCWGNNSNYQLGDGTTGRHLVPTAVAGLTGVVMLAAGHQHTCALDGSGQAYCWGDDSSWQIGGPGDPSRPVAVDGLSDGVEIAAGAFHSCARRRDGRISCWGPNSYGEIGDGTGLVAVSPTDAVGLTAPAVQLVAGPADTCARLGDKSTVCWGSGMNGSLGNGAQQNSGTPQPVAVPSGAAVVQLAASTASCARLASGRVVCWGINTSGELGDGSTVALSATPVFTMGLDDAADLSGRCAVRAMGAVVCWGPNRYGQVADGTRLDRNVPTAVIGLP